MVCLDFSEYMRNGDYYPSRLEAQRDAAQCIARVKTNSHPENSVGVLGMGPGGVKVLVSPTDDMGKLLASLSESTLGGEADLGAGVQVAKLALQHRKGRGAQRIIIFVGSPVENEEKELTKIAKQLKKNNVAIDIVSIGEFGVNEDKLKKLVETANNQDNSHLVEVPAGSLPSDVLYSSPVLGGGGGGAFGGGTGDMGGAGAASEGAQSFQEYGGVNPDLDPELAMALRVSMEEARAVEEASNKTTEEAPSESQAEETKTETAEPATVAAENESVSTSNVDMEVDDPVLAQALQMSMGGDASMDNDDLLLKALQMSMQPGEEESSPADSSSDTTKDKTEAVTLAAKDPKEAAQLVVNKEDFEKMIADLPGVDISDPKIQDALNGIYSGNKDAKGEKKEEEKKD